MSPPTCEMSDAPKPGRLPLFTFDSDNTLTVNEPSNTHHLPTISHAHSTLLIDTPTTYSMSPPTCEMSDAPEPGRLPLLTFDSDNTLTVNKLFIPPLKFDEENGLVSEVLRETALKPLLFDDNNVLTTELPGTQLPAAISPTIEQGVKVVTDNISVVKAQTWPSNCKNCENCQDQVARRPSIFVSKHSAKAINRYGTLQHLILDASTKELAEMTAILRLELHSRQLNLMVQPSSSGTNSTPNSAVRPNRTRRLGGWDTVFDASGAETANASDADMEI